MTTAAGHGRPLQTVGERRVMGKEETSQVRLRRAATGRRRDARDLGVNDVVRLEIRLPARRDSVDREEVVAPDNIRRYAEIGCPEVSPPSTASRKAVLCTMGRRSPRKHPGQHLSRCCRDAYVTRPLPLEKNNDFVTTTADAPPAAAT